MNEKLYKLILTYDIRPNSGQEYYQFVLGKYVPAVQQMGLEMMEAWTASYGDVPNRTLAFVSRDHETMMDLLSDEEWIDLNDELLEFVTDFDYKVVNYRQGFQL